MSKANWYLALGRFLGVGLCWLAVIIPARGQQTGPADASPEGPPVETITVTASRVNLIGTADSASQGSITQDELTLRPVYRVGQLLESVPGLVVTAHSGEGKANQYLLRGFNLDHGIDLANFIDDMPINRPTNTHGEGYSDLNFIIPQTLAGVDFTKGPYYAAIGDFGAVGSQHMRLLDDLPTEISTSIGTLGEAELFSGGTLHFEDGARLWGAVDLSHLDGPFEPGDNFRKTALALRYSRGTDPDGASLTALYYKGEGRNGTDVPQRAITEGLIGAFGDLDPTDGARSTRWSLSGHYGTSGAGWTLAGTAYAIHSTMILWNNFTHFLNDPVNGDQEQQDETRTTLGGGLAYQRVGHWGAIETETSLGLEERHDSAYVDRRHTKSRVVLDYCNDGDGDYAIGQTACTANQIAFNDVAPYVANTTRWRPWLRTIIGLREDYANGTVNSVLSPFSGSAAQWLFQPKATLALGPWAQTEFYVSAGKGFHTDDLRGVIGGVPLQGTPFAVGPSALMAKATGEEFGIRNASIANLDIQVALFREDFSSELLYDQDAGQDQATAPSRREGIELSAQYHPTPWLELNMDLASSRARYFKNAATLAGTYQIIGGTNIANAPDLIGSFGLLIDRGAWFGGFEERILGSYPLNDGPPRPRGGGYAETNLDIGYRLTDALKLQLSIFNLLDQKAYAAEFYYATAITAREVALYGATGVSDYQVHRLEPLSARLTLSLLF